MQTHAVAEDGVLLRSDYIAVCLVPLLIPLIGLYLEGGIPLSSNQSPNSDSGESQDETSRLSG